MKPVNLNQLLFHPKTDSLSFFLSSCEGNDQFLKDMEDQLHLQQKDGLKLILDSIKSKVKKIIKSHPDKVHGFYISDDFQGYVILEQKFEPFCIIGKSFHVRPLVEEVFSNPEFMLINVSFYDVKVYRGDFQHIEVIQQYEFDELPKNFNDSPHRLFAPEYLGLIPYKTILSLKTIAQKVMDLILYHSLPVIVTGLDEVKSLFLRYFDHSFGVITHFQEDFYEKTCVEILEKCKTFRFAVMDYYSAKFKERLKKMMSSKRLITDLQDIIRATFEGKVVHLVLPPETKLWGGFNPQTGEYELDKKTHKKESVDILNELAEEVMKQGGRIQILGPHFFPQDAHVLAILKGSL